MATTVRYDFRNNEELLELYQLACDKLNTDYRETLRSAVRTNNFAEYVQLHGNCQPECIELMTIRELAETMRNEHSAQFIDKKALHKVLFGPYGIVKASSGPARRLAIPIQVTYTKGEFDPVPHKPIITSGRHRLLALLILLGACGLTEEEIDAVPVRVTTCVVRDEKDFAMIMETNNSSRRQSSQELSVHKLSSFSVTTNDLEELLDNAASVAGKTSQHAAVFAQAVALQTDAPIERTLVWAAVKGAYVAVKGADKENRKPLADLFLPVSREDLSEVTQGVAEEVGDAFDEALRDSLTQADAKRLLKEKLAHVIAKLVKVAEPVFPTAEERDRKRMESLEAKATELRNRYNA
jgi:hypothetical protein